MKGEQLVVNDREWVADAVQHWTDSGPSDRPAALSVLFYDLEDHDQWVGNIWSPFDLTDLSRDRLHALFRNADTRSWRDSAGRYWWIRNVPPGTVGPGDSDARSTDGVLSFHARDSAGDMFSRVVAEVPPIGLLRDEELERLLPDDARRDPVRAPPDAELRPPRATGPVVEPPSPSSLTSRGRCGWRSR